MKKGQMMGPRKIISIVIGLIFLVLGGLPLANRLGFLEFSLPVPPAIILWVLSVIGGVFLVFDGLSEGMMAMGMGQMIMFASYILAVVLLAIGLIPLLNTLGFIAFNLPEFIFIPIIFEALYVVVGFLLLYGGTQGM